MMRREHLMNNGAQLLPRPLANLREATRALRSVISMLRDGKLSQEMIAVLNWVNCSMPEKERH